MGRYLSVDNMDEQTKKEGDEMQIKNGERWGAREWMIFRTSRVENRERAAREAKLKAETRPVVMTSRADTGWARKLEPITKRDNQDSRNNQRFHESLTEADRIARDQKKWDDQTRKTFEDIRGY